MYSFSFSQHTVEGAHVLARNWAHKLEYYYQAWVDSGEGVVEYAGLQPHVLGDDFWQLMEAVPEASSTFRKMQALVGWLPR